MAYNPNMYLPQPMPQYNGYQQNMSWNYQPTATQPINGLVSVTGIEGAKAYQMPPNSSMPLFDKDDDFLYVKTTDAAGYPTLKVFRFEAVEQAARAESSDYVTKADFEALAAKVDELSKRPARARKAAADGE